MTVQQNKPCPEGRALGAELARITDVAEKEVKKQFPQHAERCKSCAFSAGTFPNGCLTTVADALKCAVEGIPFHCHQEIDADGKPADFCAGWMMAQTALQDFPLAKLPYELSEPVEEP